MFTVDDDFEIDEDFLSNAFDTTANKNITNKTHESCLDNERQFNHTSFQDIRNSRETGHSSYKGKENLVKKNAEFLELWKSNENNLFNAVTSQNKSDPRSKIDISRTLGPRGFKTEVFTRPNKNVVSRKFPGPAGLLPERNSSSSFSVPDDYISNLEKENESFSEFEEQEVFSQTTNKLFEEPEGPWQRMVRDLGQLGKKLISTINLSTLQVKQARNGFKVPFLAVFVQSVDCSLPDPSVVLKDEKEEIHGTLHRDLWEEWKEDIVIGSVLVLRSVGVISAGNSSRRYFLNITGNNIVTIYSPSQDSCTKVIKMNSSTIMDTSLILDEWEKLLKQSRMQPSPAPDIEHLNRPLFNMYSPSPLNSSLPSRPSPVRPQFSQKTKVRGGLLPLGSGIGRFPIQSPNNLLKNNQVLKNKFPPCIPNPRNSQFSTPCTPQREIQDIAASAPSMKRPKTIEASSSKTIKPVASSISMYRSSPSKSIFNISDSSNSIVESVLDGIDTDSLFEDF